MFVSEIYEDCSEILATTDQSKIFRKLTDAVQALMESGHYFHTTQEVDVCTGWDGQTITLPRGIEVPLAVNVDGSPTYFRGRLFQYHVNKGGMYNPVDWAWDDRGFVSTIMDIRQPSQVVAVAEHSADAGQTIRLIGTDSNNRELTTQLPDGKIIDGLIVPIHAQSDFPYGTIEPDGITINTRSVAVSPISEFVSQATHQLSSGESVILSILSGSTPKTLVAGNTYYVGVTSANAIQLYQTSLDAQNATNPVIMSSILGAGQITLTDSRKTDLLTGIRLQSIPGITIDSPNEVSFSLPTTTIAGYATSLPSPLISGVTYFAQPSDSQNMLIYTNLNDAENSTNPVLMTGATGLINIDIRKPVSPQTTFVFAVPHNFNQGDQVQANSSGGSLPQPLIAGQNYYVNYIDDYTISLHINQSDATASTTTLLQNPIVLTTLGTGTNSLVKLIPATSVVGQTNQITAPGLPLFTPTGSGASATAVIVGVVTNVTINNGGTKYTTAPSVTFSDPPSPPANTNQIASRATGYAVMIPDAVGSTTYAVGSIVITSSGNGYTTAPVITIGDPPSPGVRATATPVLTTSFVSSYNVTNGGSGYTQPPQVTISGGGGTGATAVASIDQNGVVNAITAVTEGTGYTSPPSITISPSTGMFVEFTSTGSLPSPLKEGSAYLAQPPLNTSTGTFTIVNPDFTPVNVTSASTGTLYVALSRAFGVGFNNYWTGDFNGVPKGQQIFLSSDYLLPTGVNNTQQYYLNVINSTTAQVFPTAGQATGTTGSFIGSITAKSTTISNITNTSALSSGQTISGVGIKPNTTITNVLATSITISQAATQTLATASLQTGIVPITGIGTGQAYYSVRVPSYPAAYNNLLAPSTTEYLNDGMQVQFSCTGTLPYPLTSGTNYTIQIQGYQVSVYAQNGSKIIFENNGVPTLATGQMSMNIVRNFSISPSTSIYTKSGLFENASQIQVRPDTDDILPTGLVASTLNNQVYYYTRPVGDDKYELYDTAYNANNTASKTGRISFVDTGKYVNSTFYADELSSPVLVKTIRHIEKPTTNGYVSLYAFDYGRSNDMALIGQYHPSETNPKYRRIRIGKHCAWARIIYRVKHPTITSVYDYIPIENGRAIIAALHAVDLEDKDFMEQAQKYWATAIGYLKNQNESMEGHAMQPPQINNITYGDYTDDVMF